MTLTSTEPDGLFLSLSLPAQGKKNFQERKKWKEEEAMSETKNYNA